jgi:hypothetical protein
MKDRMNRLLFVLALVAAPGLLPAQTTAVSAAAF